MTNNNDNPTLQTPSDARTVDDDISHDLDGLNAAERKYDDMAAICDMNAIRERLNTISRDLSRLSSLANDEPAELLGAKLAAQFLGIARSTFLSKIESGQIPIDPLRIGSRVLWRRSELIRWLDLECPGGSEWRARTEKN